MTSHNLSNRTVASGRVHDVDALRGIALLGILVVNITFMASAYPGNLVQSPAFSTPIDDIARFTVAALFSMKFYLLFSFLFGYSFVLQLQSARRAGRAFVPRILRRLGGLFVLGALSLFLFSGDILSTYAVVGLILLAMHRVRDVVALRTAAVIFAVVLVSFIISALFLDRSAFVPGHAEAMANAEAQTQTMLGSFSGLVQQNLDGLEFMVIQSASLQGPMALAMFLLGMVAARRRLFADLAERTSLLRRVQLVGYPVGLAGGFAYAALGAHSDTMAAAISVATSPFLAAAYVASLLRLLHSPRLSWLRRALAPAGRLALTNYLAHAVIGFVLFTGVGLGLAGRVSPPLLVLLAVVVFVAQTVVSAWWLQRHRYGPAEYLLRVVTHGGRPPRRTEPGTE
ncbi:DUF418 domain-containing protein [Brevibacterium aurantiacum]|uniref:DUF418 domain-containing protein n=1 Tax=Brevibacterium aurantiacum TaxID=273384 RepID=UPI001867FBC5|nr:DUF418 domain-containing protein [Brevibacterium aurantiacum]